MNQIPNYEEVLAAQQQPAGSPLQVAAQTSPTIPAYGYELNKLMGHYGVSSPVAPRTQDQSILNQYLSNFNRSMYGRPSGGMQYNRYLYNANTNSPVVTQPGQDPGPNPGLPTSGSDVNYAAAQPGGAETLYGMYLRGQITLDRLKQILGETTVNAWLIANGRMEGAPASPGLPGTGTLPGMPQSPFLTTPTTPAAPALPVAPSVPSVSGPAGLTNQTGNQAVDQAWMQQSQQFDDQRWRNIMDVWAAQNPNATKAQVDQALMQFGIPQHLYGYAYTKANVIDNPLASAGSAPATAATGFVTPNAPTGPGGQDMYDMLRNTIQYASSPDSIGGAGIGRQEADQIFDIAKTLGLSIPQLTEQVNMWSPNAGLTAGQVADAIRWAAPDQADAYFGLVGTDYDPSRRYAQGGHVSRLQAGGPPLMLDTELRDLMERYELSPVQAGRIRNDRPLQPAAPAMGNERLEAARQASSEASQRLRDAVKAAGETPAATAPNKAEMYWRLAQAFATPGKTGHFSEGLGAAAGAMAEQGAQTRQAEQLNAQQKQALALKLAEMEAGSAKDAYALERELAMQERERMLPQSGFGKQALDELGPDAAGTPEYYARVRQLQEEANQREELRYQAAIAREERMVEDAARRAAKMSPTEMRMLQDAETSMLSADIAIDALNKAIELSPNAYTKSVADSAARAYTERTSSSNPKVVATRQLEQLVTTNVLNSLKLMFGGNPTEGERAIALATQGLDAISVDERNNILSTLLSMAERRRKELADRIQKIESGEYIRYGEEGSAEGGDQNGD